jgi:hypothetical protein
MGEWRSGGVTVARLWRGLRVSVCVCSWGRISRSRHVRADACVQEASQGNGTRPVVNISIHYRFGRRRKTWVGGRQLACVASSAVGWRKLVNSECACISVQFSSRPRRPRPRPRRPRPRPRRHLAVPAAPVATDCHLRSHSLLAPHSASPTTTPPGPLSSALSMALS